MSTLSSLKAVRTRYRNTLGKEITNAEVLLSSDKEELDVSLCIQQANKCVTLLKSYCAKLNEQMSKLLDAITEDDEALVNTIVDEDCELVLKSEQYVFEVSQFVDSLNKEMENAERRAENMREDERSSRESERMLTLQEDMHKLMLSQMNQQREFLAKQSAEDRSVNNSVKLPKLELNSFNGDKMKWTAFWDAFECTVHSNKKLSDIERFNYLVSKLTGEAHRSVAGLALSKENYHVAVDILKDRFGKKQEIVDLHYEALMNIPAATNKVENVKVLVDSIEKHLRCLEVLKEDVNQHVFVSMIRSKLPEDVLYQLEIMKGPRNEWSVAKLRQLLREYVSACEHSQSKGKEKKETPKVRDNYRRPQQNNQPSISPRSSAETLFTTSSAKGAIVKRDQCRYCEQKHWSDECPTYKTIEERKRRIKNSCYLCLRDNHRMKDCRRRKTCVHCGEQNAHHRSLCPKKFKRRLNNESVHMLEEIVSDERMLTTQSVIVPEENVMITSGEIVLMQTAKTRLRNLTTEQTTESRLLLDCGSQRTYIAQRLADELGLREEKEEEIKLITFGSSNPTTIKTKSTTLSIQLIDGAEMQISANIVPVISGSIHRKQVDINSNIVLNNLVQSVRLADNIPTESETTSIELLIGNDYYLDLVLSQKIEVQPGLYLLGSKFGWLLKGRTTEVDKELDSSSLLVLTYGREMNKTEVFHNVDSSVPTKPDLQDFWNIEAIGVVDNPNSNDDELAMKNFKDTLKFEDGRYLVTWPWKKDNPELPVNKELALGRLKSCVKRMKDKPELMKKYHSVIQDQLEKGVIEKVLTNDGIQHYIPHHAVIKPQNTTTKLRVVYDASARSRSSQQGTAARQSTGGPA